MEGFAIFSFIFLMKGWAVGQCNTKKHHLVLGYLFVGIFGSTCFLIHRCRAKRARYIYFGAWFYHCPIHVFRFTQCYQIMIWVVYLCKVHLHLCTLLSGSGWCQVFFQHRRVATLKSCWQHQVQTQVQKHWVEAWPFDLDIAPKRVCDH